MLKNIIDQKPKHRGFLISTHGNKNAISKSKIINNMATR